jgi:putative membrane protein
MDSIASLSTCRRNLTQRCSRAASSVTELTGPAFVHAVAQLRYTSPVTNRILLALFAGFFVWSLIRPHDYFTWFLEVFPAIIGIVLILAVRRRFPLTPLLLTLLTIHAMVAREILIRRNVVRGRGWRYFIIVSICLAISAAYELLEWRVSVASGSAGDAFLGTQGDVWDTQEDMATALAGALMAPLLLGRLHDRQLMGRQLAPLEAGPERRESR